MMKDLGLILLDSSKAALSSLALPLQRFKLPLVLELLLACGPFVNFSTMNTNIFCTAACLRLKLVGRKISSGKMPLIIIIIICPPPRHCS